MRTKKLSTNRKAFTLIEVLVATLIFAVLMTGASMAFANTLKQNARINLQRKLQEESNYLMEKIAKEIRNAGIDYASHHIDKNVYECEDDDSDCYAIYTNLAPDDSSSTSVYLAGEKKIYLLSADGNTRTTINFPYQEAAPDTPWEIVTMVKESYESDNPDPGMTNWILKNGYSKEGLLGEAGGTLDISNSISSPEIVVEDLTFLISPSQDPHHFYEIEGIQTQPTVTITLVTHIENGLFSSGQSESLMLQTTITSRYYDTIEWEVV